MRTLLLLVIINTYHAMHYKNSSPSYFKSVLICCIFMIVWPLVVNAVMYVAVLPLISSVISATMTESVLPGTNLKLEKPCVGLNGPNLTVSTARKFSSAEISILHPMSSSFVSLYRSREQRLGKKYHLRWICDQTPDS